MKINQLSARLGAEVTGIDLSRELPEQVFRALRDAFLAHSVLVIRDQDLDPDAFVRASRRFGEMEPYESTVKQFLMPGHPEIILISNVKEDGRNVGIEDAGQYWHTDRSYVEEPAWASLLYARELPVDAQGVVHGDTRFASTVAAFAALPGELKERLGTLQAVHRYIYRYTTPGARPLPEVRHPIALHHPFTGARSLYVNQGFTDRIADLDPASSERLLAQLYTHLAQPRFQYVHQWRPGDIVMWDNFATQHNATGDYKLPLRRLLWRTTIKRPAGNDPARDGIATLR